MHRDPARPPASREPRDTRRRAILGAIDQLLHVEPGGIDARGSEQTFRCLQIEGEVPCVDLEQATLHSEAWDRQSRLNPGGQDETDVIRKSGRASPTRSRHGVGEVLEMVDDHGDRLGLRLERFEQDGEKHCWGRMGGEGRERAVPERLDPVECNGEVGAERRGIVVVIGDGQPGGR
jgi:hypothetical protein